MNASLLSRHALAVSLVILAGACAQMKDALKPQEPPKAASPQVSESALRDRAKEQLAAGIKQYESGDYEASAKSLAASLDHGFLPKADQSIARKHLAFIHCAQGREAQCGEEFRKAFEINPDFSLSLAEDGHPAWGPVYRKVRTQLIMEREAADGRGKSSSSLGKAEQLLADGLVKYGSGDVDNAIRLLEAALKEGLAAKDDKIRAMKHVAFSLCLKEKYRECRAEFVSIYDVDRDFDLTPAEVGHPSWSKTFAAAKAQAKKAIAAKDAKDAKDKAEQAAKDKAAKDKAEKDKAKAAPAAGTPKKN